MPFLPHPDTPSPARTAQHLICPSHTFAPAMKHHSYRIPLPSWSVCSLYLAKQLPSYLLRTGTVSLCGGFACTARIYSHSKLNSAPQAANAAYLQQSNPSSTAKGGVSLCGQNQFAGWEVKRKRELAPGAPQVLAGSPRSSERAAGAQRVKKQPQARQG